MGVWYDNSIDKEQHNMHRHKENSPDRKAVKGVVDDTGYCFEAV